MTLQQLFYSDQLPAQIHYYVGPIVAPPQHRLQPQDTDFRVPAYNRRTLQHTRHLYASEQEFVLITKGNNNRCTYALRMSFRC
jgi:hypothetical protein